MEKLVKFVRKLLPERSEVGAKFRFKMTGWLAASKRGKSL
jgi:hypothetical protein